MKNLQWLHQAATAAVVEELESLKCLRKQQHPYQVVKNIVCVDRSRVTAEPKVSGYEFERKNRGRVTGLLLGLLHLGAMGSSLQ